MFGNETQTTKVRRQKRPTNRDGLIILPAQVSLSELAGTDLCQQCYSLYLRPKYDEQVSGHSSGFLI